MDPQSAQGDTIQTTGITINVSAPGKVILHGEHSVVYGKLAIAASLGLRTHLRLAEIVGDSIIIESSTVNLHETYNLKDLKENILSEPLPLNSLPSVYSWEEPNSLHHEALLDRIDKFLHTSSSLLENVQKNSVRAVLLLLAGILGSTNAEVVPLILDMKSDLNIGAGTGSSASFLVSVSAALIQYVKAKKNSENFSKAGYKISNWEVDLNQFSAKELEMISSWAFTAEKIFHGVPSGIDNTICTYGSLVEFRKGLEPKLCAIQNPIRILLINTHVPRETKTLLKKVIHLHTAYTDLVNNILNAMEDVAFIALKYIDRLNITRLPDQEIEKIYHELGELVSVNHNLLRALGVSHLRLDEAIHVLAQYGLCGKLTGAGGGGYAFALIPPAFDEGVVEKAMQELVEKGFSVASTILGGKGVTIDSKMN